MPRNARYNNLENQSVHKKRNPKNISKYNNTSSAYDYETSELRPIEFVPKHASEYVEYNLAKRREQEKRRLAKLKKEKENFLKKKEAIKKDRMNQILCYMLAFCLVGNGVFVLMQFDNNNLVKQQISEKNSIISEQEKQIADIQIRLAESIDINEIEKIAINELGMQIPATDQIVYVTLPKNISYIDYDGDTSTEQTTNSKENEIISNQNTINGDYE